MMKSLFKFTFVGGGAIVELTSLVEVLYNGISSKSSKL